MRPLRALLGRLHRRNCRSRTRAAKKPVGSLRSAQCACARMGNERGLRLLNERALALTACSRSTPVGL
ncbi:hypothetical protein NDU88_000555 [Pleurodeles waltl]|uniref:Uncharacterized protein n=1 Tax=Pleurodeles waltl TaxID=8319 RepID=A0AAV7SAD2_PLEWA|nr:hypothetical protein NDU88_000555 [Pleurodeles waltl]